MLEFFNRVERDHPQLIQKFALGLWFLVSLLQAATTELAHDEAYYWMYSQNLDWGYFHQPPLLAVLINIGGSLVSGELGIRLFTPLISTVTIWMIAKLAGRSTSWEFYILAFSVPLLNVQGFLTSPDVPLMFFACAILLTANKFSEDHGWKYVIPLGVLGALVLYSKYHGILVLMALVFANPQSLKKPSFWAVVILISLFMLPHLLWQIENEFPTIRFNWSGRMDESWQLTHILNYLGGVVLIIGPVLSVSFFLLRKELTSFKEQRNLISLLLTVLIFFLIQSTRGRVEANWMSLAIIPALALASMGFSRISMSARRRLMHTGIIVILLLVPLRVYLGLDRPFVNLGIKEEFHGFEDWAKELSAIAEKNNAEIVFLNNYKYPSKYSFYSGKISTSYNTSIYTGNDFDQFGTNKALEGKRVIAMTHWDSGNEQVPLPGKGHLYAETPKVFRSFNHVRIRQDCLPQTVSGDSLKMNVEFKFNGAEPVFLEGDILEYEWFDSTKKQLGIGKAADLDSITDSQIQIKIPIPNFKGKARLALSVHPIGFHTGKNHHNHWLVIE